MTLPKKKWQNEAERKRITRQRKKLIEQLKEIKSKPAPNDIIWNTNRLQVERELNNLERSYFSQDRPSTLKYGYSPASSKTRKAMWKLRHGKNLSEREAGEIRGLRASLSRRTFAKLKENRKK